MVEIRVNTKDLERLAQVLRKPKSILEKGVLKTSMKRSLTPMLNKAKSEAPRRTGATVRDMRATVRDNNRGGGSEIVGLVGVSQQADAVGWRTHFITQDRHIRPKGTKIGTKGKFGVNVNESRRSGVIKRGNNFLQRAYDATIEETKSQFGKEIFGVTERKLKRALKKNG